MVESSSNAGKFPRPIDPPFLVLACRTRRRSPCRPRQPWPTSPRVQPHTVEPIAVIGVPPRRRRVSMKKTSS
ncbi:hypothetical protein Dimus_024434, partial [Dionaea muscipula]